MDIEDRIILNRPDIAQSSLKTYLISLKNLRKKVDGKTDLDNTAFLKDFNEIMKILNNEVITTRKNRITAILVALGADEKKDEKLIDKYQLELKGLNDEYSEFLKTQKKTETQKKNWLNYEDLVDVYNDVIKDIKRYDITKKEVLNKKEFDLLQQLLILRTYLDYPLRNDFADMKIIDNKEYKNLDTNDENNYLALLPKNKKMFVLNDFKNKNRIGRKQIEITKSLNKIINIWLKHNKTGYYLIKNNKTPMSPNNITKYLNKIFMKRANKKISSSLIRHIIISKISENEPTIKQEEQKQKEIEEKFLHSSNVNKLYRKVD